MKAEKNSIALQRFDVGIFSFISEIYRVSHEPGISQWCTPGHNRGVAWEGEIKSRTSSLAMTKRRSRRMKE